MKNRSRRRFGLTAILFVGLGGLAQAQLINGSMESPFVAITSDVANGSVPSGWTATGISDPGFFREQSSKNSPFSNIFADNSSSVHIQDYATTGTTGSQGYGFLQTFSPGYTAGEAGFDFMMENMPASGIIGVQFNNTGDLTGGSGVTRVRFELNNNGNLAFYAGVASTPITAITAGTWYHVLFAWDISGAFFGSVTAFEGATSIFSGTLVANGANNISGVQVRDRDENPAGDIYLDNIYVVPEPAATWLLSLAGLLFLFRPKRLSLMPKVQ